MRLTTARLCLDCEEIHHDESCPACASEASVYLARWIPQMSASSVNDARGGRGAGGYDTGRGVAALRARQPETSVAGPRL
jgi:hypothetical protein